MAMTTRSRYNNGLLQLSIGKPGTEKWTPKPKHTSTPLKELKEVFSGLGPKWNQVRGAEKKEGARYQDLRNVDTSCEVIEWEVDHEKLKVEGVQYNVADRLRVVLKEGALM
jgi:hypothetical protein